MSEIGTGRINLGKHTSRLTSLLYFCGCITCNTANIINIFLLYSNKVWEDGAVKITLHEKCPYSELFWPVFSRIRTECVEIQSIFPYSVRMQENAGQNNSEYGHFLCSVTLNFTLFKYRLCFAVHNYNW